VDLESEGPFLDGSEFRKHLADVVKVAIRDLRLPDSACDDVTQIVLMKLFTLNKDALRAIENFNAYLFKAARNEALRLQQQSKSSGQIPNDDENLVVLTDKAEDAHRIESEILLGEIWETLKDDERELFRLMLIGYRETDMAVRLGLPYSVVRKRVSRLRAKLRELLLN
jgi:RNA polymerase sigma factor (sigma-70 family)